VIFYLRFAMAGWRVSVLINNLFLEEQDDQQSGW
jgi:hypothetical protein